MNMGKEQIKNLILSLKFAGLFLISLFMILLSIKCVPVGHKGVIKHWGKVSHQKVLGEGLNFVVPVRTTIQNINVKLLKFDQEARASSKDLQDVKTLVTIQFSLFEVSHLFQQVGDEDQIIFVILKPAVQESVKAITAKYTAEELITMRAEAKLKIEEETKDFLKTTLTEKGLKDLSIRISNVAITDFSFSEEFNKSIEMKVKAEQRALQAKNEKIKKITDAEAVAEKIRIESIATANAIRREARALKENPLLIEFKRMEKWDGKLPNVTGGAIPMFHVDTQNKQNK